MTGEARVSVVDSIKQTLSAAPGGYLIAWLAGVPVEKWAAFAALVWTLWLIADKAWGKWRAWQARRDAARHEENKAKRRRAVEMVVAHRENNGDE